VYFRLLLLFDEYRWWMCLRRGLSGHRGGGRSFHHPHWGSWAMDSQRLCLLDTFGFCLEMPTEQSNLVWRQI
jgi:hypothetical protein